MKNDKYFKFLICTLIISVIGLNNVYATNVTNNNEFITALGGDNYAKIQNNEIVLLNDTIITSSIEISSGSYILNLNGKNISANIANKGVICTSGDNTSLIINGTGNAVNTGDQSYGILLNGNTDVIINNGTFTGKGAGLWASDSKTNPYTGELTINGGNYIGEDINGISIASAAKVTIKNATATGKTGHGIALYGTVPVIVESGTFTGKLDGLLASGNNTNPYTGELTINGGEFIGEDYDGIAISSATKVTIKNVTANGKTGYGIAVADKVSVIIESGTFTGKKDGLHASNNKDNPYTGELTINGGNYIGENGSGVNILTAGSFTINNGNFQGNSAGLTIIGDSSSGMINGGKFYSLANDGFYSIENGNYGLIVINVSEASKDIISKYISSNVVNTFDNITVDSNYVSLHNEQPSGTIPVNNPSQPSDENPNNQNNENSNPKTGTSIFKVVILLIVSIIGLIYSLRYKKLVCPTPNNDKEI